MPKFFLSVADTETTMIAVFYHDIVEMHHSLAHWEWGGFSDVFPDISTVFLFNYLTGDGRFAMLLLSVFYLIGWLAATAGLAIVLKRPNQLSLFAIILLFWVAMICNFSLPYEWGLHILNPLFSSMYHSGSALFCLVCLVQLLRQISEGWSTACYCWMFVLILLVGASDPLFMVVFVGPALLTVGLLTVAFGRDWRKYSWLGVNIAVAGVVARLLAPHIFQVPLMPGAFNHWGWQSALTTLKAVGGEMSRPEHHLFAFMGVLDVLTVLGGMAGVIFFFASAKRSLISPTALGLVVFCSSAVLLNWSLTFFIGLYTGMYANRYLVVALITPLLIAAFALHATLRWRPWLEKSVAVMVSIFTVCVAFLPQEIHPDYVSTNADVPYMKKLFKEQHIQYGLADYWRANLSTFISRGEVPLAPMSGDGTYLTACANSDWFGIGFPPQQRPHFRLIYLPRPSYLEAFGPPDEIIHTPYCGDEIWIYSEERAITYNEKADSLSNKLLDDSRHVVRFIPSELPSATGTVLASNARIATDGQDREGYLNGGPNIALKPGRYRLSMHYAYLLAPAPDKMPVYDLVVHTPNVPDEEADSAPLPFVNTDPQVFEHEFTVSKEGQTFEMRILYHASGTIRFDYLDVTRLDP